ncbi:MAG: hypothetical protein IKS18_00530 [Lachnospiraceae bacterium]|nr:hypothetical protein [Lachnospiraceae bacterium]
MKAKNLKKLQKNGICVPEFIVVESDREIDLSFSDSALFAVRSSAEAEDSADRSFAGQFETMLNVPREEVPEAVRKVLQSAGQENVRAYRETVGQEKPEAAKPGTPGIRVIIQRMLTPELSGVVFTANPAGILNETVVTAGAGLGEGIVRDEVPVTTCYYNRDDGRSLLVQDHGAPKPPEGLVEELSKQGQRIEEILGCPADVEFAVENGTLWILQARPITTLPKATSPIVLDSSNIVESYPGVSLPVTQDFAKDIYYHVFRNCLLRLSKDPTLVQSMDENLRHMVDTANGRIYYRISSWYDILKLLPFSKKIIEIWQNSLGVKNRLVVSDQVQPRFWTKCRILLSVCRYLLTCPKDMRELNTYFSGRIGLLREEVAEATDLPALGALYQKLLLEITEKWDITLVNDVWTFLFTALSGKKGKEKLANVGNLESMKPAQALSDLAALYRKEGESEAFSAAFEDYIDAFGDRCPEDLKLETRTFRTDPDNLRWLLRETELREREDPEADAGHIDQKTEKRSGPMLRRAKQGIANREISRMNRSRLFGIMREIILKSGEILAREQRISETRDVMYLRLSEIFGGTDQEQVLEAERQQEVSADRDFRVLVEERKKLIAQEKELPAFERLVFAKNVVDHRERGVRKEGSADSKELFGTPVSFGKAEGEVLIVRDPKAVSDTTGKILVTVSTDPGWVHILRDAAGIIAERGSILSHTAIIARELKKPSIVNVSGATVILRDGDYVQLDTEAGAVRVLYRAGQAGSLKKTAGRS